MLPSLGQHNLQSPDACLDWLRNHSAKQVKVNKKDIDPANVPARPLNEEVNASPAAFGALRSEYNWKTFNSNAKVVQIDLFMAGVRMGISQLDHKG